MRLVVGYFIAVEKKKGGRGYIKERNRRKRGKVAHILALGAVIWFICWSFVDLDLFLVLYWPNFFGFCCMFKDIDPFQVHIRQF